MPKVTYTAAKGLSQQSGEGVDFTQGDVNFRKKVISVTDTTKTLTAEDSGALILLNNGTTATTVTLPAGSTIGTGCCFTFVPLSNNTGGTGPYAGYTIKRGTDGELIKGGFLVGSDTADNTDYIVSVATNDTLHLSGETVAGSVGIIGTRVECVWDGSSWQAWGTMISAINNPGSVTGSFENT